LITAAVCDYRVCVKHGARFGLNEVPIGIPMPAVYVRMLAYAWGGPVTARTCLFGEDELPDGMTHEQSRRAHRRYFQELKGGPAAW